MTYKASVVPAATKADVPAALNDLIVGYCAESIAARGVFTVALSGGSLPGFLSPLKGAFEKKGVDPHFDAWYVILADERCVPSTDKDSNLGALKENMFKTVPVPENQIYGIDEKRLSESTASVAAHYETVVKEVMGKSGGKLDLAVLGFGPDGHTCSLFPGHELLKENSKWVAPIEDSPKPPPKRITLTFPVLNMYTRHVIFCGAGASKAPILQKVFCSVDKTEDSYVATMTDPAPYPCGMVRPNSDGVENTLDFVCDAPALEGVEGIEM